MLGVVRTSRDRKGWVRGSGPGAGWGWGGAARRGAAPPCGGGSGLHLVRAPRSGRAPHPRPAPRHIWSFLSGPCQTLAPCLRPIQGPSFPACLAGGPRAAVGGSSALRVRPRGGAGGLGTRCQGGGGGGAGNARPGLAEVNAGQADLGVPRGSEVPTVPTGFIFCPTFPPNSLSAADFTGVPPSAPGPGPKTPSLSVL